MLREGGRLAVLFQWLYLERLRSEAVYIKPPGVLYSRRNDLRSAGRNSRCHLRNDILSSARALCSRRHLAFVDAKQRVTIRVNRTVKIDRLPLTFAVLNPPHSVLLRTYVFVY